MYIYCNDIKVGEVDTNLIVTPNNNMDFTKREVESLKRAAVILIKDSDIGSILVLGCFTVSMHPILRIERVKIPKFNPVWN
jgi:hypothetical protein